MNHPPVRVLAEGRPGQIGLTTWLHLTLREGLPDVQTIEWTTGVEDLGGLAEAADEVITRHRASEVDVVLARIGSGLVLVTLVEGSLRCLAAARDQGALAKAIALVREKDP